LDFGSAFLLNLSHLWIAFFIDILVCNLETLHDSRSIIKPLTPNPKFLEEDARPRYKKVLSQRVRCQTVLDKRRKGMAESMEPLERRMFAENSTVLGRRWLSVIPFNKSLALSDYEVSAALHFRTLSRGSRALCHACGQVNELGHDDVCEKKPKFNVARHELLKRIMVDALKHCQTFGDVTMEPHNPNSALRTDIRFTGSRQGGMSAQEFDVTVVSMATQDAKRVYWEKTEKVGELQKVLDKFAQAKRAKYVGKTQGAFRPLVFSIGGAQEEETAKVFEEWQKVMSPSTFSYMCRSISLTLLKARTKYFVC
jgi:hypothetical protein